LDLFNVEYYRDLEIWLRGYSRSLKLVPFESLGAVSYSLSIVTMAVSVAVCEIFSVKEWCDLENRVRFVQGHWKWHHLIDRIRVPISNYGAILYSLRFVGRTSLNVYTLAVFCAPAGEVIPSEFRETV